MKRILLIEDDRALSNGIALALKTDEISVEQSFRLSDARSMRQQKSYDLIILDVNLPDGNGLTYLKEEKNNSATPVIILTANDMETDVVAGLEMGADDYITKPFSLAILRARVNTQLRKQITKKTEEKFVIDDFSFDFQQMNFSKNGVSIELSKTEQKLLKLLLANRGQTMERGMLADKIWNDGADFVDENALSVTIKRLRGKLEEHPSKPDYIKTVYGIGYLWTKEK